MLFKLYVWQGKYSDASCTGRKTKGLYDNCDKSTDFISLDGMTTA